MHVLMGLAAPKGVDPERLYRAQLWSADRQQFLRMSLNIVAILFVWGVFYRTIDFLWLALWSLPALAMTIIPIRASRTRVKDDYAGVSAQSIRWNGIGAAIQGVIWGCLLLVFGRHAATDQVMALWTLTSLSLIHI